MTSSNAGNVNFVNSAFWGPSNQIAKVYILADRLVHYYNRYNIVNNIPVFTQDQMMIMSPPTPSSCLCKA